MTRETKQEIRQPGAFSAAPGAPEDGDLERQAYLEESHIESTQFGTGRFREGEEVVERQPPARF
ncbi:MAG: hypothetical protein REI09_14915 [Candidatus Dactylopiibacterium sp.]|nr:hypothetical protein [Candidatus Dactylopiibacterium sp.]